MRKQIGVKGSFGRPKKVQEKNCSGCRPSEEHPKAGDKRGAGDNESGNAGRNEIGWVRSREEKKTLNEYTKRVYNLTTESRCKTREGCSSS